MIEKPDENKILKLFFLLEKVYNYPNIFKMAEYSTSFKKLNKNNEIAVFGEDKGYYHLMYGRQHCISINYKKTSSGDVISIVYNTHEKINMFDQIFKEIYEAAVEHNFLHLVGKFH